MLIFVIKSIACLQQFDMLVLTFISIEAIISRRIQCLMNRGKDYKMKEKDGVASLTVFTQEMIHVWGF